MKVLEERDLFLQQVDAGTLEKVKHTQDYVIRTGSGDILMSFRWLDHSPVFLHMTQQQTSLWTENAKILSFAKEISGSGKEELFEFLIAGWYGMNLMMPEFKWPYGYPFVIALSVAIVAFMIWLFRRNKWL